MVVPMSAPAENKFIHEEMIADQKRRLHGLRRNLERLHDKRRAEQRQDHRNQKRFDVLAHRGGMRFRAMRRGSFARFRRPVRFPMSLRSSVLLSSQLYQGRDRSGLLRFFFCSPRSHGGNLPGDPNLDAKRFLMIRAALRNHMIGARCHTPRLQVFLQRGFMVGVAQAFGLDRDRSFHKRRAARSREPPPARHPDKPPRSRLRKRPPEAPAWFVRRFSLLRGRGASTCPYRGVGRTREIAVALTRRARLLESCPSLQSGNSRTSSSLTINSRTASPRNSSFSLLSQGSSAARSGMRELCINAWRSRRGSRN